MNTRAAFFGSDVYRKSMIANKWLDASFLSSAEANCGTACF